MSKVMKQTTQQNPPAYLRLQDMCTRYRVSGSTIWNWCKTNGLPAPVKLGLNTSVWELSALLEWEEKRKGAK